MVETLGKYKIDGYIAEGGMARILRAKTEGVGGVEKVVALKCLKGSMQENDNFVQMLLEEARITVRMTHKNICQVYGLEHDEDKYFMVMEYVDGLNLADLCKYLFGKNRVFPIEAAVFITMEVCSGLSYAHRMTDDNGEPLEIVHRDVNPQNICISREGEVKLIDFGIAKAKRDSTETMAGTIKGKFNYMSPEQARGDRVDQRADVFALGAVLYEMLCGHMLYPLSLDDARLRTKTRMADFVPIETYLPDIPEKLKRILAKALTRDMTQRFPTSRDFLLALTQFYHDTCKVYDSLNLSMLVEKCLAEIGDKRDTLDGIPLSSNAEPEALYLSDDDHTTLINTSGMLEDASAEGDDSSTTVYNKADFDKIVGKRKIMDDNINTMRLTPNDTLSFALNRSIDLDINDVGADSTVMVNFTDVNKSGTHQSVLKDFKSLFDRILSVDEKKLFIAAISLIIVLVVAIVLFIQMDTGEDKKIVENTVEQVATIHINSTPPGAKIMYGKEDSRLSTPSDVPLEKENITLQLPFYQPVTLNLREVKEGIPITLIPLEGRLNITSDPSGATVLIDNQDKGTTPFSIVLPMNKTYKIELLKDDYRKEKQDFEWKEDKTTDEIHLTLKKKRSSKK